MKTRYYFEVSVMLFELYWNIFNTLFFCLLKYAFWNKSSLQTIWLTSYSHGSASQSLRANNTQTKMPCHLEDLQHSHSLPCVCPHQSEHIGTREIDSRSIKSCTDICLPLGNQPSNRTALRIPVWTMTKQNAILI